MTESGTLQQRVTRLEADMEHLRHKVDAHILECQATRIRIEQELRQIHAYMTVIGVLGFVAIAAVGPLVSFFLQKFFG